MLILFNHVTPKGIARALVGHTVTKPKIAVGIRSAMVTCSPRPRRPVFDVFVTADKNMRYQQNLADRRLALVVLSTPQWPVVRLHLEKIAAAVTAATPGSYTEVNLKGGTKDPKASASPPL